ncbi:hypothetical protein BGZ99_007294 [Dissophora globulifera]|uniref:Uncharacterized protein n=1 Tax=Dissophora globulifera TaxID=979702 RepID=A0A9P6RWC9_9FUNG|nr:hypothetical protein BGZ99_007294 [Dissophora globulifera]
MVYKIKLIDTQGVLDTKIDLATVLESLKDELTGRFNQVNTIMLVLECARFTRVAQEALNSLIQLFKIGNVEGSKRLLLVVTKVEHLPIGKQAEIRRSIIEHSFFKTIGISVKYLKENTIEVFAGQSEGVDPLLAPVYTKMREQSKAKLSSALARNNSPMTISHDPYQLWDLIKKYTGFFSEDVSGPEPKRPHLTLRSSENEQYDLSRISTQMRFYNYLAKAGCL